MTITSFDANSEILGMVWATECGPRVYVSSILVVVEDSINLSGFGVVCCNITRLKLNNFNLCVDVWNQNLILTSTELPPTVTPADKNTTRWEFEA